jgi:hypothetical protein
MALTPQDEARFAATAKFQEKLEGLGIPFHNIHCFGSTIHITTVGYETALQWVDVLGKLKPSKLSPPRETRLPTKARYHMVNSPTRVRTHKGYFVYCSL